MLGDGDESGEETVVEDGRLAGDGGHRPQPCGGMVADLDDESADAPSSERDPNHRAHRNPPNETLGKRVPEPGVDREGGDVRDDPDGGDLRGQSETASARNAPACDVSSHGNPGRPKWPYAEVAR